MNKNLLLRIFIILSSVLFIHTQSFAEPHNLGLLKTQLARYHDSGKYLKEINEVTSEAAHYMQQEIDANQRLSQPKKLALVLDIDETSLSNYANMQQDDFANNPSKIRSELLEANEPAIQPTLDLYQLALQNNVAVFFVTGRDQSLREATTQNLHNAGYMTWSGLEFKNGAIPTITYKTAARNKISQLGYTIIASIGDQNSDLIGGYAQRTFKLPNPFYYLP